MTFLFPFFWIALWALSRPSSSLRHEISSGPRFEDGDRPLLEVFQAFPPPLNPEDLPDSAVCSYPLMNHVFGNSAGKPYVGAASLSLLHTNSSLATYRPLCGSDWDVAVLNLSVVSYGRQFDRLGVFLYIEYRLILEYLDCRHRSMADLHC